MHKSLAFALSSLLALAACGGSGDPPPSTLGTLADVETQCRDTKEGFILDAELQSGARHQVETTNGGVSVHLRGDPSLRVDARTVNGAVVATRPITTGERTSNALAGTIGTGQGQLLVRTTNGRVTIE